MSEWIDIKERMPVGRDHILSCNNGNGEEWMVVGYFNRLSKSWCVDGIMEPNLPVTHWMPLPPAPRSTGETE